MSGSLSPPSGKRNLFALSERARKRGLILAMGCFGGLVNLDETVLGVSLFTIRHDLGLSLTTTHWIVNSYLLAFTCFAAIGGKALDLFGLRPALVVTCSVFAISCVVAGFSNDAAMLISMRTIQGLCAAILFPMALTATTLTFNEEERGRAIGTLVGMVTVFLALGPLVGGVLTQFLSWRWVFWINVPIVLASGLIAFLLWREPDREVKQPKIDLIGLVLLVVGLTSFIFGLVEGPDLGWSSPTVFGTILCGVIGLAAFAVFELRHREPLIDVRLFRLMPFHTGALIYILTQMSKMIVVIYVPRFLQMELSYSALWAGMGTLFAVFPFPFLSARAGSFADKHGPRIPVVVSMAVLAIANLAIAGAVILKSIWILVPALLLWGIALPYAMVPAGLVSTSSVPSQKQGEVSGLVITARLLGSTLGMVMSGLLVAIGAGFESVFVVPAILVAFCSAYGMVALKKKGPID